MSANTPNKLSGGDLTEFVGHILDIFEDFLEAKGIQIPNDEKDEAVADGEEPESIAILFGTDYGSLQTSIEDTLVRWDLAEIV